MSSQPTPARTPLSSWPAAQLKGTLIPMVRSAIMVLLLILANMSYLFGTSFDQAKRAHNINILAVDYDHGAVGTAVSRASESLQAANFPTIKFGSVSEYSTPSSVRNAVCKGDYWAAIYVPSGASAKLASAIDGTSTEYNPASSVTYIYNQARYAAQADSVILSNIQKVVGAARGFYYQTPNGTAAFASLNASSTPSAIAAYLNPIQSTADLIRPTTQGPRVFFNTVNVIIPTLAQFFCILALNGIGLNSGLLVKARVRDVWLLRFGFGKIYSLLTALTVTGYIWAFRENWDVHGSEFGKTVLVFWLYMDVQWQVIDGLVGSFLPMQYMPYFVLTWMITNISSTIGPFELMPGFYKIGYALPAHEAYSMMVLAWSGCADQSRVALPVLFAWEVAGHVLVVFSIRKRCADAGKIAAAAAAAKDQDAGIPLPPRSASTEVTLRPDEEQVKNEK